MACSGVGLSCTTIVLSIQKVYHIYTDYCQTLEERHGWVLTHAALPLPA
jgi:hypothetical protein